MSEGVFGLVILIVLSAACAGVSRRFIRNTQLAAVVAAVLASGLLLLFEWVYDGYLDPFAPIAFGGGTIIGWIAATIVIFVIDRTGKGVGNDTR